MMNTTAENGYIKPKGGRELDKELYLKLQQLDTNAVVMKMAEAIRASRYQKHIAETAVMISALAYWNIPSKSYESLHDSIERMGFSAYTKDRLLEFAHENFELIQQFSDSEISDSLKAIALFGIYHLGDREKFGKWTPAGVAELAIRLLDLKKGDTLLNLCSDTGSFLLKALTDVPGVKAYAVERMIEDAMIAEIRMAIAGIEVTSEMGSVLAEERSQYGANKVFLHGPFGLRIPEMSVELKNNESLQKYIAGMRNTIKGDWLFPLAAILSQKKSGRTVAVVTGSELFSIGRSQEIRAKLIEEKRLEGIIALAPQLLNDTAIPIYLAVFSENNETVKMVDASKLCTVGRRQNTLEEADVERIAKQYNEKAAMISLEMLRKESYNLLPATYLYPKKTYQNSVMLETICEGDISRGMNMKASELDSLLSVIPTGIRCLRLKDIQNGQIGDDLMNLTAVTDAMKPFCIPDGSIIISKIAANGEHFKSAAIHVPKGEIVIGNGNLYFFQIDAKKMDPAYVEAFFNSKEGKACIGQLGQGTVMRSISIKDLRKLSIPVVSQQEQQQIAEAYRRMKERLSILKTQQNVLQEKLERLFDEVQ